MPNLYSRSVDDQAEKDIGTLFIHKYGSPWTNFGDPPAAAAAASGPHQVCSLQVPGGGGHRLSYGSSVVDYKLGTFTQDECCSMCLSNDKCVAASLLDKTHGSHEGCWLQNGANLVPRNAPGVTLCDSQRKDIPSIERVDLKLLTWTNIHTPNAWMDHPLGTTLQAILVQNHGLLSYRAAENAPALNCAIQE